jgi:hypothetical protein
MLSKGLEIIDDRLVRGGEEDGVHGRGVTSLRSDENLNVSDGSEAIATSHPRERH